MFTRLSSSLPKSFPQIDNNNTNCLFMFFFVTDYPANGGPWCFLADKTTLWLALRKNTRFIKPHTTQHMWNCVHHVVILHHLLHFPFFQSKLFGNYHYFSIQTPNLQSKCFISVTLSRFCYHFDILIMFKKFQWLHGKNMFIQLSFFGILEI